MEQSTRCYGKLWCCKVGALCDRKSNIFVKSSRIALLLEVFYGSHNHILASSRLLKDSHRTASQSLRAACTRPLPPVVAQAAPLPLLDFEGYFSADNRKLTGIKCPRVLGSLHLTGNTQGLNLGSTGGIKLLPLEGG